MEPGFALFVWLDILSLQEHGRDAGLQASSLFCLTVSCCLLDRKG